MKADRRMRGCGWRWWWWRRVCAVLAMGLCAGWSGARADEPGVLAAAVTLHVLDWGQTRWIAKNPDRAWETNVLLGRHPSVGRVNNYFLATGVSLVAAHYLLPPEYAKWGTLVWFAVGGVSVARNAALGIHLDF